MLVTFIISTFYFINISNSFNEVNISNISRKKSSKIYDNNGAFIKNLTKEDYENITYDDLPDVFINALISCEDVRFFMHEGIDIPRLLSAIKNDALSMSLKEGASTLTQQLVKNMMLTNDKSLTRKLKEMYLSKKIEKLYSKKEILEFYCNYICFDGINHGISSACHKFFNKPINDVTLPEAALLAGICNAPTAYSPINNKEAAFKRKNIVLSLMKKHGYINENEYQQAKKITIDEMLVLNNKQNNQSYDYQAYIDIACKQIYLQTSYDPYITPMEIHTYMDESIQKLIDSIQKNENENIIFNNPYQQFASCIINNQNNSVIGVFGGRNYNGQKILNRAYDVKIQPASTIKVLLDYALAFEHLSYNNYEIINDNEINYPYSNKVIKNVDNTYMGELTIDKAIGYSRNTSAIETLNKVINKIGTSNVINYLKSINLMDDGKFSYSYGLGGYSYGVSVFNLASAYSMLANYGTYKEPLLVKSIKLLDGSNKVINFENEGKKVLSDESAYLLIDVLKQVMNNNYWSIRDCKPNNINVYAKTGTTSFDESIINKNNYPKNASKDKWLASFNKDYTIVSWSGFDKYLKDEKTYFTSNNTDANILKEFTKLMYSSLKSSNTDFTMPEGLVSKKVVLGSNLLATPQVASNYIVDALYKKDNAPTSYFIEPLIEKYVDFDYFILNNELNIIFNSKEENINKIYDINKIMGGLNIIVDIYENNNLINSLILNEKEKIITIPLKNSYYSFKIYYKYTNGLLNGNAKSIDIYL